MKLNDSFCARHKQLFITACHIPTWMLHKRNQNTHSYLSVCDLLGSSHCYDFQRFQNQQSLIVCVLHYAFWCILKTSEFRAYIFLTIGGGGSSAWPASQSVSQWNQKKMQHGSSSWTGEAKTVWDEQESCIEELSWSNVAKHRGFQIS